MFRALTIGGSDCSGGAGVQADLKTFHRFGAFGMSALTLITAQNTRGVQEVHPLPPELVVLQIKSVMDDLGTDAAKTGALASVEIIEAVADAVQRFGLTKLVVDPVMISKHGDSLLDQIAIDALTQELIPRATLITPNLHEASALLGRAIRDEDEMKRAVEDLLELGAKAVVLKGGGIEGDLAVDLLHDGKELSRFASPKINTPNTHGSGCTFSAAITVLLAQGKTLKEAVGEAKAFLNRAIAGAPKIGKGHGPVNHWA